MSFDKKRAARDVSVQLIGCVSIYLFTKYVLRYSDLFDDTFGSVIVHYTFSLDVFTQGHDTLMAGLVHDAALCLSLSDGCRDKSRTETVA